MTGILNRVGRSFRLAIVSASLLFSPSTTSAQKTTTPSGAISGHVTNAVGEPLAGCSVYVTQLGTSSQIPPTSTDAGGNFKIDNLEAGLFRVWANLPGYVSADLTTPGDTPYYHTGAAVNVTLIKAAVITGRVSNQNSPIVATTVRAIRLRDDEGKALPASVSVRERYTDDRGVYRLWGLAPGTYLISAGGPARFGGMLGANAYATDTPVYFPSSTRDTASEITVRSGEEATADIQYHSEPGHSISGVVAGASFKEQFSGATIGLTDIRNRSTLISTSTSSYNDYAFALYGVPDGEYELSASQLLQSRELIRSEPRRIVVRGADTPGIKLMMVQQARIAGKLLLERDPKVDCARRRDTATQETIIIGRRYEPEPQPGADGRNPGAGDISVVSRNLVAEAAPDAQGLFALTNLVAGTYRIESRMPASGWYLRSIALGVAAQSTAGRNASLALARDGVSLKTGERISGLTITVTEGAASVRGRIIIPENKQLPPGLRVYLVPVEKENAIDVLRFFETQVESDGTFVVGNIAPGKYWLVTRQIDDRDPTVAKSIRRDSALRSTLLQDALKSRQEITLKPCERVADYELALSSDQQK